LKRLLWPAAVFPALLFSPQCEAAAAQAFMTGGRLADYCADNSPICTAYAIGVADVLALGGSDPDIGICLPVALTRFDVVRSFQRYVKQKPGYRSSSAAALILEALRNDYPCAADEANLSKRTSAHGSSRSPRSKRTLPVNNWASVSSSDPRIWAISR
jgi:hypothetical protein